MFLRQTTLIKSLALSGLISLLSLPADAEEEADAGQPVAEQSDAGLPTAGQTGLAAQLTEQPESSPLTPYVRNLQQLVEQIELSEGAYSEGLPERLLSLGQALQAQGRHEDAIKAFKRGVHLARINGGLYSAEQIPLLDAEIASYIATGQFAAADERQFYLYRVQQRSLTGGQRRASSLIRQARWQQRAYSLRLDDAGYSRLVNMWDLYRLALTDIAEVEGDRSDKLLEPLQGMLQAQYLISAYEPPSSDSGFSMGSANTSYAERQDEGRFWAYRSQSYERGSAVIRAMTEVRQGVDATIDPVTEAEGLVQLGDWQMWHGQRSEAEDTYARAYGELEGLDDAQEHIARLFGEPRALPYLEGVNLLPPQAEPDQADIVLEFGVTERGKVVDLERLAETEGSTGRGNRLMRQLRRTPFRPRYEDGVAVATEKVVRAYVLP